MLKINLPHSTYDYRIPGVYKITFADDSFYIGSSVHMRKRAGVWNYLIESKCENVKKWGMGTKMLDKIKACGDACFDIVEICHASGIRDREAFYLHESKDNPLMLSDFNLGSWKPVLQYNKEGVLVRRHTSISEAARYVDSPIGRIQDVLTGARAAHKGMAFIFETDYAERRKGIVDERKIFIKKAMTKRDGRDIVACDMSGVEVRRFNKLKDAANFASRNTRAIRLSLSGIQESSGGYVWKYV